MKKTKLYIFVDEIMHIFKYFRIKRFNFLFEKYFKFFKPKLKTYFEKLQ